ncbi:MAG: hypothetical protein LBB58_05250 [Cellulomonadaceae bacterium]|jgi:hypothetical protein|nr:hypothetical protein [Cellulomonadaceae bacterium]
MATMTLTEFNQNPSRATRLADDGELLVLRRGEIAYRLTKAEPREPLRALHPILQQLISNGQATLPTNLDGTQGLQYSGIDAGFDSTAALLEDRADRW